MRQLKDILVAKSRYRTAGVYFFALIVLIVGGVAVVKHQAIYDQLYSWKLIARPERLTELYFTEQRNLPATYAVSQQQVVAFTVHNLEYRATTYHYGIAQQSADETTSQQLASGSFDLGQDGSKAVQAPITLVDMGDRSRIAITLFYDGIAFGQDTPAPQTQSIYYWLTKEAAP